MTNTWFNSREVSRFLRFAVVGVVGAVVDFGVANLLTNLFHTSIVFAGAVSFIAAIINNFLWNRYWTYPDSRSKPVMRQLMEFSLVSIMGLTIRIPVLAFLEPRILHMVTESGLNTAVLTPKMVADNLTLAVAVVIVMFWNFFVNRYWTYSDVE